MKDRSHTEDRGRGTNHSFHDSVFSHSKGMNNSIDSVDNQDLQMAETFANQLNYTRRGENRDFSKIMKKKLVEKRIIVRDGKEHKNKQFRDMLQNIVAKRFKDSEADSKPRNSSPGRSQTLDANKVLYIDNQDLRKISNKVNLELGLNKLKEQLLDDYVYLARKERNHADNVTNPNLSVLSKDLSKRMIKDQSSDKDSSITDRRGAGEKDPVSRQLDEINEFLMEKTVLNFNGVGRDPVNEGLSYDLQLATALPEDYQNQSVINWFEKGINCYKGRNLFKCVNCFKQVVILDSYQFQAIYNLGCLYESVNDYELAFKWFYL